MWRIPGIAFGIGLGGRILIILVNITIITLIINFVISRKDQLDMHILASLCLILAGGSANVIDRVFRGYVVDYINVFPKLHLPIFNFADICIFVGVVVLGVSILIYWVKKK
ncbi:MAG: signal peptidase II [Firmicutes bacterium]|nr:signal peptidase II [Bacillota bacterium]